MVELNMVWKDLKLEPREMDPCSLKVLLRRE